MVSNNTDKAIFKILDREGGSAPQAMIVDELLPHVSQDYVYSRIKTMGARNLIEKDGATFSHGRIISITQAGREALQQGL